MKVLLLIALAIAIFLVIGRTRTKGGNTVKKPPMKPAQLKKKKASPTVQVHPYRATSIVLGENACEAARALVEKPFLDKDQETPLLPLPNCTAAKCTCKYAHHQDRREIGDERRFSSGLQAELYATGDKENRRFKRGGRRQSDS